MNHSYQKYLNAPKAISFEECNQLHQDILKGVENDKDAIEIYNALIEKATEYAVIRSNWTTRDIVWKLNEDPRRTATHDALISHFNILARYFKSIGKSYDWRIIWDMKRMMQTIERGLATLAVIWHLSMH